MGGIILAFVALPGVVGAAGLVPECGSNSDPCQFCHVIQLVNNVVRWLVVVLTTIAALLFAWAGFRMVVSGGNSEALTYAKNIFYNVSIGFLIVLAGWLIVDTVMKALLTGQAYGMWNTIQCVAQPVPGVVQPAGYENRSRGTAYESGLGGGAAFTPAQLAAIANLSAPDEQVAAAAAQQGLNAEQTRNLQALMRVESGGCRNMTSPAGAVGCMQITPATARTYDPSLRGLSDPEVSRRLMDNAYNISLGTRIYADLNRTYNGDARLVHAAYNGGPGANQPSRDCPGLRRWECQWDNPQHTIPNTGYRETRNYVERIPQVASQLGQRQPAQQQP